MLVIDAQSTRVLKSIRTGSKVSSIALGASGQRALASIPGQRSVAVLATDYHAEINRFYFGDDPVGPVALDDTGTRALTNTPPCGAMRGHGTVNVRFAFEAQLDAMAAELGLDPFAVRRANLLEAPTFTENDLMVKS